MAAEYVRSSVILHVPSYRFVVYYLTDFSTD